MSLPRSPAGVGHTWWVAERLAPVPADLLISSRPERPRGRTGRWTRRLLGTLVTLALVVGGTVATLHFLAIHRSAQEIRATARVPPELPARVLVVLARPGQAGSSPGGSGSSASTPCSPNHCQAVSRCARPDSTLSTMARCG